MAQKPAKGKLSDQHETFCLEYLKDLNGTQAAIRAMYSNKSAAQQASRLLTNEKISARIVELKAAQMKRLEVDSDGILRELTRVGFSDLRELYEDDGSIKHPKEWPDELARAIASIEVFEEFEFHQGGVHCENCQRKLTKEIIGQTKKVKFWPKVQALELLGKHKKLFTDRVEHSGTVSLEDLVSGSKTEETK